MAEQELAGLSQYTCPLSRCGFASNRGFELKAMLSERGALTQQIGPEDYGAETFTVLRTFHKRFCSMSIEWEYAFPDFAMR